MVYYKIPGANFIRKCHNCSCIAAAAAAIPCAGLVGVCFLFFNLPAVYSLFCSGVLDCSSHSSKALLSIIWCSQLKLRKAFGLVWLILPPHSLCSAQQRCSQSICMHMIGGHFG